MYVPVAGFFIKLPVCQPSGHQSSFTVTVIRWKPPGAVREGEGGGGGRGGGKTLYFEETIYRSFSAVFL